MEFPPPQRQSPRHPKYDAIHRALLTGLLSNVGTKSDTYEYLGPHSGRFSIFPGSGLFSQKPKWIVAAELVETTKLYARTCAAVQPQWIERAAAHLVERSHSDPRWDSKTGSVIATEKVTLYGLVLIPARIVPFGPINPKLAREFFIHHALVLSDLRTDAPFLRHNAQLIAEVETLEAKIRQRNLLADAATRFAFYDARLPLDVHNAAHFEKWRRAAEKSNAQLLYMDKADLLRADAPAITPENYPDKVSDAAGGLRLPLTYRFEPGEVTDGITITVPVAALPQLRSERHEWLVPGMLEEKIAAMLRALPGALRRNFVPVPTWAKSATEALMQTREQNDSSLRDALAEHLARQTGVEIKGPDFADDALPPFLRMNFKVVDDTGKPLGLSRDLPQLQHRFASQATNAFASVYDHQFHRDNITAWNASTIGDLPESLVVHRFNMRIVAYPSLVDHADSVSLRLLPSKESAEESHRAGVRRLFRIEYRRDIKSLRTHLPDWTRMALQYWLLGPTEELKEDLLTLITDRALFTDDPVPRTHAVYNSLKHKAATRLFDTGEKIANLIGEILQQNHALSLATESAPTSSTTADLHDQLIYLLPKHFVLSTPFDWLPNLPRYLAGMRLRLEKLQSNNPSISDRDLEGMSKIALFWNQYLERKSHHDAISLQDPNLTLFRWMLEEYRISLFAQELGTLLPISERRMEKQWEKVRK